MRIRDKIAMSQRQRMAMLAVILLIAIAMVVNVVVDRAHSDQCADIEQEELRQMEQYEREIDSAKIDTTIHRHKRKQKKKDAVPEHKQAYGLRPIDTF